jgi:thiamine-monophosphate kinase
MTERELISWVRGRLRIDSPIVEIGPGDDTALIHAPSLRMLLAIDTIAEGVDFIVGKASPRAIGRKALAVNLSDIAAMGGRPLWCMISVNLREGLGAAFARGVYLGLEKLSREAKCPLVGGDVTGWKDGVVVTVAIGGTLAGKQAITRSGAKPGDVVLVTGALGGSILGKHLRFTPRLEEGAWLAQHAAPSAMIDMSDGLGVDAGHIAAESGVALEIDAGRIPVSPDARRLARRDRGSPLSHAVGDGEDFELLFTMARRTAERVLREKPFRTRVTAIGRVVEGSGAWLVREDGKRERIDAKGYEHLG